MTFLPCKEMFDDYSKMVAGGGLALSLLIVVLISLLGTPAMTSAAESTPTSVSVERWKDQGSVGFIATVSHADGLVTVSNVTIDDIKSSGIRFYVTHLKGKSYVTSASSDGKFIDMPGEPGVLLSFSIFSAAPQLSDIGYDPTTLCYTNMNDGSTPCITVALKDKPQTASQVVQMPTTGAPTGLTLVGLTALGLCLLGVSVLARRRG